MKIKCFICALLLFMMLLCSCATKDTATEAHVFPTVPDRIIVGANGNEIELSPDDQAFDKVVSSIRERAKNSAKLDVLPLDAYDPESDKHLSYALRQRETFVEFIYNECKPQSFLMCQSGGGSATEDIEVQKLFFSLSGQHHKHVFIGQDADYEKHTTLGTLADKTDFITYVRDFVAQETASEK